MKILKTVFIIITTLCFINISSTANALKPSDEYILNKATTLFEEGKFDEACELLDAILTEEYDPQLTFLKGQCKFNKKDYATAAFLYELMLDKNTNLPRVRLELARALTSMGKTRKAKQEYEKVLELDLPEQVKKNILKRMNNIDYKQKWGGIFSFGYLYDSNVNAAPADPNIMAFGIPMTLESEFTEKDDSAATVSISVGRFFNAPLADEWRVDFYGNLLGYNSMDEYSTYSLGTSIGPNYYGEYQWAFPVSIDYTWQDGKETSCAVAFSPSVGITLKKGLLLTSRLQIQEINDFRDTDEANGLALMWSNNMKLQLSPSQVIEWGATLVDNNANDYDYNRYVSESLNLGYYADCKQYFRFSLLPTYTRLRYDDPDPVDSGEKRTDNRYAISANIYRDMTVFNRTITPVLSYTYTKNDSNIDRRDYERNQTSLMIRIEF